MKNIFEHILNTCNRKLVIHQTYEIDNILCLLKDYDLVFFDDCLYSQYIFIKNNIDALIKKHINCVIGFSTEIYRTDETPIYKANCAQCHERIHNNDKTALNGYMSLNEIKELLEFDNVYLACHGAKHLDLQNLTKNKVKQSILFKNDILYAYNDLKKFKFNTDIFVYPYAYDDFLLADKIVKTLEFKYIFAGKTTKRIEIEKLIV